ncbi:hypothetical protein [Planomonospora algeriensis]
MLIARYPERLDEVAAVLSAVNTAKSIAYTAALATVLATLLIGLRDARTDRGGRALPG